MMADMGDLLSICAAEAQRHVTRAGQYAASGADDGFFWVLPYDNPATGTPVKVSYDEFMARYIRAAAVAWGASRGDAAKVCYLTAAGGCSTNPTDAGYGYNRGLWQLNSRKYPTLTDSAALNQTSSTAAVYTITAGFTDWAAFAGNTGLLPLGLDAAGQPTPLQLAYDTEQLRAGTVIDKGIFGLPGEAAVLDAAQGVFGSLGSMLDIAKLAVQVLLAAAQWVADRDNWLRLLEIAGGIGLVALGGTMVARDLSPAAAIGRIAKAVR